MSHQGPGYPYPPQTQPFGASPALSTASMVLGIVGTVLALVPCMALFAAGCAVTAIVFGVARIQYLKQRGMPQTDTAATTGFILGIVAAAITFFMIITLYSLFH
jgi:hypothetical protein